MNNIANTNDVHFETVLTLARHEHVFALARGCREAALTFLNDSDHWGAAELAMWLYGPYAQLTEHVAPDSKRGKSTPALPLLREIDASTVERVMRSARVEVRQTLDTLFDAEGAASFAFSMLATGIVIRCEDTAESSGWAPTRAAQRLADRVLSLFAADYLTRPGDYEFELSICNLCRTVEFDAESRVRGTCGRHLTRPELVTSSRPSGVVLDHSTLPYTPKLAA